MEAGLIKYLTPYRLLGCQCGCKACSSVSKCGTSWPRSLLTFTGIVEDVRVASDDFKILNNSCGNDLRFTDLNYKWWFSKYRLTMNHDECFLTDTVWKYIWHKISNVNTGNNRKNGKSRRPKLQITKIIKEYTWSINKLFQYENHYHIEIVFLTDLFGEFCKRLFPTTWLSIYNKMLEP